MMNRIGKRLVGLVLAGAFAAFVPARARRSRAEVAGNRPGVRAARQGGRPARGPHQAARHGRP